MSAGRASDGSVEITEAIVLSAASGARTLATSTARWVCSIMFLRIRTFFVTAVGVASGRLMRMASSIARVASTPCTLSRLLIASIRTWPATTLTTAAVRGSLPEAPIPSMVPSIMSAAMAFIMLSPDTDSPWIRRASRDRRTASPSVSLAFTIAAMLVSVTGVLIGSGIRLGSNPKPKLLMTVFLAALMFASVRPPGIACAILVIRVENGFRLALLWDGSVATETSEKSGSDCVTVSMPPVAIICSGYDFVGTFNLIW